VSRRWLGRLKAYLSRFPSPSCGRPLAHRVAHLGPRRPRPRKTAGHGRRNSCASFWRTAASATRSTSNVEMARESDHRISIANANVRTCSVRYRRNGNAGSTSTTWSTSRAARWRTRWSMSTARCRRPAIDADRGDRRRAVSAVRAADPGRAAGPSANAMSRVIEATPPGHTCR